MPDFRVHCVPTTASPSELSLSPEESHHLVVVNRARTGDEVVAFDGRGREWVTTLVSAHKVSARLRVREARSMTPLPYSLTLAQALPKGPAMEAIVKKATEIGAARIVPLESERTQVHFEGERSDKKIDKWRTAALEAAKQCGNPFLPEIAPVVSTAAFLADAATRDVELKLVASLHPGATSLKPVLAAFRTQHGRAPKSAAWLIGPEGDFSPAEMAAALAAGFLPITLGPLVLRSETAATYALSVVSYELQNA